MTMCRVTEEPCNGKLLSTVLKTSGFREELAEFTAVESAQQPAPQRQSTGFSGDSVGCQLLKLEVEAIEPVTTPDTAPEPTPAVESEFDTGRRYGKHDALRGWHPSYKKPRTDYARGYLAGYNAVLNRTPQQPNVTQAAERSVSLDPRWDKLQHTRRQSGWLLERLAIIEAPACKHHNSWLTLRL